MEIKREYAALMLIEILFEEKLVNKATYNNVKNIINHRCVQQIRTFHKLPNSG